MIARTNRGEEGAKSIFPAIDPPGPPGIEQHHGQERRVLPVGGYECNSCNITPAGSRLAPPSFASLRLKRRSLFARVSRLFASFFLVSFVQLFSINVHAVTIGSSSIAIFNFVFFFVEEEEECVRIFYNLIC